ncbi:methyltransferase domain-containing protein [Stackebrandtia nassauensis]|uniref:Protein-L-isoaspartate O-methyltransferase n=1 Tax=Stackebrandtia nassauensis (strain DSM 44728 / CIP 108903 / NRRL B-16338 / NBRC 102104 / LLR-40K-21) TaxID=446470 RepID=D3PV42_STANL|nr:methyltransferase domain-containing protein [Stackebrandtia nassauensis]ADD41095.1 protein-L-isoaspartate(D-aspartate) O-methyltransferase [Stackebrandtia nassauensis DSM 44728]
MNVADDWRERAARLADYLASEGLDPAWTAVFARVPRHEFVNGGHAVDTDGVAPDAADWNREELLREAYADQVVVTRYETAGGEPVATSSASQPLIVAIMLRLLNVRDDSRVLEIGTGPGYNACLLCTRLGEQRVTSVEIQSDVVADARDNLARVGFHPHLEVTDGTLGCPSRAPYDRVIATCGLSRIPEAWLDQLAPHARVVAPMNFGGALAVLDRRPDGSLSGRFPREAGFFMELRHPGDSWEPKPPGYLAVPPRVIKTDIDVDVLGDMEFRLWLELAAPDVQVHPSRVADGRLVEVRISTPDTRIDIEVDGAIRAVEYGKSLWRTVEGLAADWEAHGRPDRGRMGMTVTPERQWVWLDAEDSDVLWEL